jgi:hypothetical protein
MILGYYNAKFSKGKEHIFNANTLRNVEKHLLEVHYLDMGGDIWRVQPDSMPAQASGIVNGAYERVILFR